MLQRTDYSVLFFMFLALMDLDLGPRELASGGTDES